jgi:hypothetical protein
MWAEVQHVLTLFLCLAIFRGLGLLIDWRNKTPAPPAPETVPMAKTTVLKATLPKNKPKPAAKGGPAPAVRTLTLTKHQSTLTLSPGFCLEHPAETRLVMGKTVNECYSCLALKGNDKTKEKRKKA